METVEAKQAITDILATAGIEMICTYVPSSYDPKSEEWQGICWRIAFKGKRREFTTDYKQGIGHLPKLSTANQNSILYVELVNKTLQTGKVHRESTMFAGKAIEPPHIADVVSCLISDASAADDTFESWASDSGYDTDSRKAYAIWEACRTTALNLNRVFGASVVEALRDPCSEL